MPFNSSVNIHKTTKGYKMKTDKYTKLILTAIAVGLILNAGVNIIEPARADDDVIIQRILFCIDGSTISDGSFSTYCNS